MGEIIWKGGYAQECCECHGRTTDYIENTDGEIRCRECWEDMIQEWDENHRWDNY